MFFIDYTIIFAFHDTDDCQWFRRSLTIKSHSKHLLDDIYQGLFEMYKQLTCSIMNDKMEHVDYIPIGHLTIREALFYCKNFIIEFYIFNDFYSIYLDDLVKKGIELSSKYNKYSKGKEPKEDKIREYIFKLNFKK